LDGTYDAKAEGFLPGGASLHNCITAHGPDAESWEKATKTELKPHKIEYSMAFMLGTRCGSRVMLWNPLSFSTITSKVGKDWRNTFPRHDSIH
jgi:homogentisate 1,2-dioxygenase